jgi:hypothetical protein
VDFLADRAVVRSVPTSGLRELFRWLHHHCTRPDGGVGSTVSAVDRLDTVVHRSNPHEPPRLGAVVSREGAAYRVRWEDTGAEETVRISPTMFVAARDTLRLEWLLDPAAVAVSFATDPDSVIWRVVRESPTPLHAREIQQNLTAYGLDPAAVSTAWKAAQRRGAPAAVSVRGRKYEWTGRREPAPASVTQEPATGTQEQAPPATPLPHVAEALGDESAGQPLRTGTRLGGLAETRLAEIVAGAGKADRRTVLASLLAVPRHLEALDHSTRELPVDARAVEAVLVAAAAEAIDDTFQAAAGWLVSRVARLAELPPRAVEPLRTLVTFLAAGPELAGLADRTARIPLVPAGGRAALLAALGRAAPEQVADPRWWSGVSLDDVVAADALGRVVAIPAVGQRVVHPLVGQAVRTATSRRQIGVLLALPAEIATHVDAGELAAALRRAGQNDPTVGAWLRALTDDEQVAGLRRELAVAHRDATAAREQVEMAARRIKELEDRYVELENEIRFEHTDGPHRARASADGRARPGTDRAGREDGGLRS